RLSGLVRTVVARAAENPQHELGIGHVHLAAVGLEIQAFWHRKRKIARGLGSGSGPSGPYAHTDRDQPGLLVVLLVLLPPHPLNGQVDAGAVGGEGISRAGAHPVFVDLSAASEWERQLAPVKPEPERGATGPAWVGGELEATGDLNRVVRPDTAGGHDVFIAGRPVAREDLAGHLQVCRGAPAEGPA